MFGGNKGNSENIMKTETLFRQQTEALDLFPLDCLSPSAVTEPPAHTSQFITF